MAVQIMLEAMEGTYALSTSTKVLLRRDCALSAKVLEVVLYMLCVLELLWGGGGCDVHWRPWKIVHSMLYVL